MLNEHDGQAGVGGQIGEQKLENFQAARGGPNPGHRNYRPRRYVLLRRLVVETLALLHYCLHSDRSVITNAQYTL
jgi:hypothetical protein